MNALIITCNTGGGHNSAAAAIEETLKLHNERCRVLDLFMLDSKRVSDVISKAYISSTRGPVVFKSIYKLGGVVSDRLNGRRSPVYYANKVNKRRLQRFIQEGGYDIVVCTHLFPAEVLTAMRRKARLGVPTVAVATDYTCVPFWVETDLDYYVIPHKDLAAEFIKKGVPKYKLLPYGIPVKPKFSQKGDKTEARAALMSDGIDLSDGLPICLVMTGSMGFGDVQSLVGAMVRNGGTHIVVVCGNNKKLRVSLEEAFGDVGRVSILGFTDKVPTLMDACDVIFTKPGGLTTTEAAVKNIPLIHTAPIPGCESANLKFFSERGMSFCSTDIERQASEALRLCTDTDAREKMLAAQRDNLNPNAAEDIYSLMKEMTAAIE